MGKKIYEKEINYIDTETGEDVFEYKMTVKKVTTEQFIQVYLEDMSGLMHLKSRGEFHVMAELWKYADYDTNQVIIIKKRIKEIGEKTKLSQQTVRNIISRLHNKKLIERLETSVYRLNPKYFFKGSDINRKKLLRVITDYKISED